MKAAVVDLGFNSAKMVAYEVRRDLEFRPYMQVAFKAKLGEGMSSGGPLHAGPVARTLESLQVFRDIADLQGVDEVIPIATSAVREAANRREFLSKVRHRCGISLRVLGSDEEALFSYAGAVAFAQAPDVVFFDLGGGTLEIVRSRGFRVTKVLSLPLGALRLTMAYAGGDGSFSRQRYSKMRQHIAGLLPGRKELGVRKGTKLVGVGGTIRALARYDQSLSEYPFDKVHNYVMARESVDAICRSLLSMTRGEISKVNAVGNRSESISAGACVVRTMMKVLGIRELTASAHGLREGVLSMYLRDRAAFHSRSLTARSVDRFVALSSRAKRAHPALEALEDAGLIDRHELTLVAEADRLMGRVEATTDLQRLFFALFGEESPLPHEEQLAASLIPVSAQNDRTAQLLMERYKPLVERRDRRALKRLSAVFALCQTLEEAHAGLSAESKRGRLLVTIEPGPRRVPAALIRQELQRLGSAFHLVVVTAGEGQLARMAVSAPGVKSA